MEALTGICISLVTGSHRFDGPALGSGMNKETNARGRKRDVCDLREGRWLNETFVRDSVHVYTCDFALGSVIAGLRIEVEPL